MSERRSYIALDWVTQEIIETLKQALEALYAYIERPEDITKLRFCLTYLHQVSGGLVMIELHGASLFSKEIEHLLNAVLEKQVQHSDKAIAIVEQAIHQLSAYINKVSQTHQDTPHDLLDNLNAIRKHTQQDSLSHADMFDPNIAPARQTSKQRPRMSASDFSQLITKLRQAYQLALGHLVKNVDLNKNLLLINKVCDSLLKVSKSTVSEPLWEIVCAIVDNLIKQPQQLNADVLNALKLIGQQILLLERKGVDGLATTPESALLKNLLYCVATAEIQTDKIQQLKKQYQLEDALNTVFIERQLEHRTLDQFVDTLLQQLGEPTAQLSTAIEQGLLLLAQDDAAPSSDLPPEQLEAALTQYKTTVSDQASEQFFSLYSARINESRSIIDTIKEQVIAYINSGFNTTNISDLTELIDQQMTALNISSLERLVPILFASKRYIQQLAKQEAAPDNNTLELLADAISGVDYYLECIIGENPSKLNNIASLAEQRVQSLGLELSWPNAETAEDASLAASPAIETPAETEISAETAAETHTDASVFVLPDDIDQEILEIFIEEGREVLEYIKENLPVLAANYDDESTLLEIRRSFHTLKGSGRTVGATHIGDFAWSVERMLNRVRDGLAKVNDHCIVVLQLAVEKIPALLQSLEDKTPYPLSELQSVIAEADAEYNEEFAPAAAEPVDDFADMPVAISSEEESLNDFADVPVAISSDEESLDDFVDVPVAISSDEESLDDFADVPVAISNDEESLDDFVDVPVAFSSDEESLDDFADVPVAISNNEESLDDFANIPVAISSDEESLDDFADVPVAFSSDEESLDDFADVPVAISNDEESLDDFADVPVALSSDEDSEEDNTVDTQALHDGGQDSSDISEMDAELLEIFISEAQGHIEEFSNFLENVDLAFQEVHVSTDIQRALHTLKGSAHMAGLSAIASLATPLESFIKDMANFQTPLDADMLALFIRARDALEQMLSYLHTGQDKACDQLDELIEEISQNHSQRLSIQQNEALENDAIADKYTALLSQALDCMTDAAGLLAQWQSDGLNAEQRQQLVNSLNQLASTAGSANYPEVAQTASALAQYYQQAVDYQGELDSSFFDLAVKGQDELDDMMDIIAAQQVVELDSALIEALTRDLNLSSEAATETANVTETAALSDALKAPAETHDNSAIVRFAEQFAQAEAELLDIFVEEAEELLEQLEPIVQQSLSERSIDDSALAELKRILHTLKGGARMAELTVLGDISHHYESLLEKAQEKQRFDEAFFTQLEQYQQQTSDLIEFALRRGSVDEALALQAQTPSIAVVEESVEENAEETIEASAAVADELTATESEPVNEPAQDGLLSALAKEYAKADPDTLEIFMEELNDLSAQLEAATQDWLGEHDAVQQADALKRILHTIKGGARMAELSSLGNVSHDFETLIEKAQLTQQFDAAFFAELERYQEQVQQATDFLASGATIPAAKPSPVSTAPAPVIEQVSVNIAPVPAAVLVTPSHADNDLLVLFLEEAKEQAEGIEEAIANFFKDKTDNEPLEELKRLLHTLKGGARMVDLKDIGDLSHDFETFIIDSERKSTTQEDNFVDGMQAFYENLNKQLTSIEQSFNNASAAPADATQAPASNVIPINQKINIDGISPAAIEATRSFIDGFTKNQQQSANRESIKVAPDLLENLMNLAGENIIGRSRLEEQMSELRFSVDEMDMTVDRLHSQLRRLEIETEAQISFRQERIDSEGLENFDPLEMDRYSHMQQLSKSLIEAASDIDDLSATFNHKIRDIETLLIQQSRVNTELQEGLMRCQMVPFSRMVPRLRRIVRQVAKELGKKVEFNVENADGELDRTILEKMLAPLEHMLRNAVDHGVEMPDVRKKAGKDETGLIILSFNREGGEIVLRLRDNGAGINLTAVRNKAVERGLIAEDSKVSDHEIMQFIMHAGFSTAQQITQISGRGVGMDVVHSDIKQLGGNIDVDSVQGQGSIFTVRLPFTVSVNRALMVCIEDNTYAIPLNAIEGIVRVSPYELEAYYQPDAPPFEYADQSYHLRYLGTLLQHSSPKTDNILTPLPVILIRNADYSVAVQVDRLLGSQEVVVKSLGPQFSMVEGVSGATVLGDGSVVIILDMIALIRSDVSRSLAGSSDAAEQTLYAQHEQDKVIRVMVVDDSVTVRKVTSRLLERYELEPILAKDGLDAITQLQEMEQLPDVMLLDIEMPRMDGFEVVNRVRHNDRLQHIPIIMITSRTGEKHRERALSLGANRYLGKPFQERELLQVIHDLTGADILEA